MTRDPLYATSVVHRFADFLSSTAHGACGTPNTQGNAVETQATHNPSTRFPQVGVRFCAQLGGP